MTVQVDFEHIKDSNYSNHSLDAFQAALFQTIPPERMGLQGEYDHHGLAKRVSMAIRQHCAEMTAGNLRITQRGAVVVLTGKIANQRLLIKLVNLAMSVTGTADVEVNGVSVGDSLKCYLEVKPCPDLLLQLQPIAES